MKALKDIKNDPFSKLCSHWFQVVRPLILEQAKEDVFYQQSQADVERLEPIYEAIRGRLPQTDQDILSLYTASIEEQEHRFAQLLYQHLITGGAEQELCWFSENGVDPRDF